MEKFRGSLLIIPRTKNWKEIDETDKYSKKQRQKCSQTSGRECFLYPYPIGLKVLEMFKPKKWLDPTAGWGDRLRCAITYGCEYTGIDSNPEMQSAYKQIIEENIPRAKCEVLYGKFQDVKIKGKYDLVFTSPPFFTKEKYEGMVEWKDVEEFLKEFLKPLFDKSVKHLSKNGHLVLYIEDIGTEPFIDLMKGYAAELPLEYQGAFYYEAKTPRPYYVWLKIK
jgi:hypothetical protein